MYHDQGLIPVKYLGVEKGVNVTLGLPLVRTSPDHGTAFDIAGTGRADAVQPGRGDPRWRAGSVGRLRRRRFEAVADLAQQHDVFRRRGCGAAAASSFLRSLLICLTIRKMMKARIMKFTAMVMKLP